MSTQHDDAQAELFAVDTPAPAAPKRRGNIRPTRRPAQMLAVKPHVAREVLAEVAERRFGIVDQTDRVARIDADCGVTQASEEDIVHHLITQDYVELCPMRDTFTGHTARWSRPVSPLRLTKRGRNLLDRWSALAPVGDGR
ncbi:hypothetical protein FB384_001363 [Prauserella sediminis]|uniref:Winged helix DNA-binding domain-containing protein n=1 Tax=Prauserella sediminis TaxID=577680 RepID=A0A839XKU5_9PSEU|nr:hypothetical protein [Prauserella sediminis]MBB3662459.1 hypothetical protein [Prauserella sediminis]